MYLSGLVSYLFEADHTGQILKNNSKKRLCLKKKPAESITLDLADRLLTNWEKILIRPEKKRKPLVFLSFSSPPLQPSPSALFSSALKLRDVRRGWVAICKKQPP